MYASRKGFTLIELMIVIAIIGILAAIAVPNFSRARNRAREAKCYEFSALLTRTSELYELETGDDSSYPITKLQPYLAQQKMPLCPSNGVYSFFIDSGGSPNSPKKVSCSLHGVASATYGG